jgi:hypothetical protein
MKKALWGAGVLAAAAGAVLAIAGASVNHPDTNPIAGVGLALAGWVFLKASESA